MTALTVLPPASATSANDLWGIELPAEIEAANRATHDIWYPENRCGGCDCRPGGAWSRFACRMSLYIDGNTEAVPFESFAVNP